jgi:two-component system response regulator YcbB
MNFFIVSYDENAYFTLTQIIENNNLGQVIKDNDTPDDCLLNNKEIDILIIHSLISLSERSKELCNLINSFDGKVIVISRIKNKQAIAYAYSLGVEYYIVEPINEFEVIEILKRVTEVLRLEKCVFNVRNILRISQS